MGLFFRKATENEIKNYKKGMEVGYLAAILLLVIDNFYHVIYNKNLLSSSTILISVLAIPWVYKWFLSFKEKSENNIPK